jgi:mevalonate kinase
MSAMAASYAGCSSYLIRKETSTVNGKSTYRYVYGHMCTKNDFKLTLKFSTSQYKKLTLTTSLHDATMKNCTDFSTYKQCDFIIKSGLDKQLGFEFSAATTITAVKGVWIALQ